VPLFFGREFRTNIIHIGGTYTVAAAVATYARAAFIYLFSFYFPRLSLLLSCSCNRILALLRSRGVFLSCQPVKVVGRPARNTELSCGVTLEIDRSPDAHISAYIYACAPCVYVCIES